MVFLTKKGLLECKPEWDREAVPVFSRLPSLRRLQATPPLQTALVAAYASHITTGPPSPGFSNLPMALLQLLRLELWARSLITRNPVWVLWDYSHPSLSGEIQYNFPMTAFQ